VRVLEIPAEVAIGGIEARAEGLAREAARAAEEAERLVLAILRGERLPPPLPATRRPASPAPARLHVA
jgi:hypothetical protein